jgi:hypothetical protein
MDTCWCKLWPLPARFSTAELLLHILCSVFKVQGLGCVGNHMGTCMSWLARVIVVIRLCRLNCAEERHERPNK